MVAFVGETPSVGNESAGGAGTKKNNNKKQQKKLRRLVSSLLSPRTVKHSAVAFTQVDDKSRSPHVKYAIVWQVVKVPLAHAQNGSRAR